ncbi:helix-hairpin-helix domain-containing protein [Lacticaseibacillus parakribbianus]|uniref:helix-hairpin-helix domain-containing protein n=1 Tax=Lacticaseibacillus parakribbianus TaxID=2970927 RepID=UPI0021CB8783|nr:Tex family protein [Lacticaseibacillus parakribbianus]
MTEDNTVTLVHRELTGISTRQIDAVLTLMAAGNTVPFIARYRKEATGSLDEVQIQAIEDAEHRVAALLERKAAVLKSIEAAGKLTAALQAKITAAASLQDVEDLYLPYKQKRLTLAAKAKAAGLEPFARQLLAFPQGPLAPAAAKFVSAKRGVADVAAVLAGAHEILAEAFSEDVAIRNWVRRETTRNGVLQATVRPKAQALDERGVYQQYYEFKAPLSQVTATQTLAMNRGEKEKILTVKVVVDPAGILNFCRFRLIGKRPQTPATAAVTAAYTDAYKRFIAPAIEREVRASLTEAADAKSIQVFGQNLYNLLMQAPLRGRVVLGFDPAYRTGCKLAVVDQSGKLLTTAVIYPHKPAPAAQREAAAGQLRELIGQYRVTTIAIGNGTASRESEQFVAAVLKTLPQDVMYVIVNEAGASVYSASALARSEFPQLPVEKRSAISIARRLQDPLAELVKIDPAAVGVGQYQHDLPAKDLAVAVDAVVERAVNRVGVDLNTASAALLRRISGLSATVADNIVAYREANGRYASRAALKKVPRLGPKAFEQAVGFLRIPGGREPLDNTDIHPESYPAAKAWLKATGVNAADLQSPAAKAALATADLSPLLAAGVGAATAQDIATSLQNPGRDLRDGMPAPLLRHDVLTMADLLPGMKLEGTVRNVVDFGAFVDIGVKHDGLVHLSHMAQRRVSDPYRVVAVGDVVTVWVLSVDQKRERIQLTLVDPAAAAN